MRRNLIIIGLTILVIFAVVFLAFDLYRTSEEEVISQFQEHQILHAQHVASQIKSYFESRASGLRALSSFVSVEYGEAKQRETDIHAYFQQVKKAYVKAISIFDENGKRIDSTDDQTPGLSDRQSDVLNWAKKKENKIKVFVSPVFQNFSPPSLKSLLAIPLYQETPDVSHPEPTGKFVGVLSLTVGLDEYLADQFDLVDPKKNPHQLWIIDKDGTLLFQSEHKEMGFRNIRQRDERCTSCHPSFDYVENILKENKGTLRYQLKNSPTKLAAFAPMEFENASWIVVVNSRQDALRAFSRKSLWGHLMLLGVVVFALTGSSTLLYRDYRSRLKVQAEARRWRERQQAEETLQKERNKLKNILDSMKDGVYIVNERCEIDYINPTIEREFGPINGRKCYEYFHDWTSVCPWCKNHEVFAGKAVHAEWYSSRTGKVYDSFSTPFLSEAGTISKLEIFRDVTERKQAEEALEKSEEQYHRLVETMNEGLGIHDENSRWTYANDKLCYMLGCFQGELIGHPVHEFLDETNQKVWMDQANLRRKGGSQPYEISWANRDGQKIPTIISPKSIFDQSGEYKGSIVVITDISDRKQAEEALRESEKQLRYLSTQLLTIQEQERKRISGELHDELGQALAVIKLRINFIKKRLRKDQRVMNEDCEGTLQYIDQVIENVRRLSRDLSPSILEDLGFSAALRWMVSELMKHGPSLKISIEAEDIDHLVGKNAHIILYRIFQEALTNVEKHAQATLLSIAIKKEEKKIIFSVEDNGKGFNLSEVMTRNSTEKGLGLATLKERVRMLGGSLNLRSKEGRGTRISFSIPLEKGLE